MKTAIISLAASLMVAAAPQTPGSAPVDFDEIEDISVDQLHPKTVEVITNVIGDREVPKPAMLAAAGCVRLCDGAEWEEGAEPSEEALTCVEFRVQRAQEKAEILEQAGIPLPDPSQIGENRPREGKAGENRPREGKVGDQRPRKGQFGERRQNQGGKTGKRPSDRPGDKQLKCPNPTEIQQRVDAKKAELEALFAENGERLPERGTLPDVVADMDKAENARFLAAVALHPAVAFVVGSCSNCADPQACVDKIATAVPSRVENASTDGMPSFDGDFEGGFEGGERVKAAMQTLLENKGTCPTDIAQEIAA